MIQLPQRKKLSDVNFRSSGHCSEILAMSVTFSKSKSFPAKIRAIFVVILYIVRQKTEMCGKFFTCSGHDVRHILKNFSHL